jgi:uncharacterized membrane-anchored protein YitT (DUF2179 family)
MNMKKTISDYLLVTGATGIIAAAVYFFMLPSNLAVGSVSGLSLVLSNFIPLRISAITFILNAILLIIGFILIGRDFGAKTIYSTFLMSGYLFVFENLFPMDKPFTDDAFLEMICYILLVAAGQALLFNNNASSGGLDIIGKILNKYLHMDLGKAMTLSGMCAAVTSVFVYDAKSVILSILGTYLIGTFLDNFIAGFTVKKRVCVLSEHYEEIKEYIVHTLHRGATMYPAIGGYNNKEQIEVQTILTRNEYIRLMDYIHREDPGAFLTVSSVNEVVGQWNRNGRRKQVVSDKKQSAQ